MCVWSTDIYEWPRLKWLKINGHECYECYSRYCWIICVSRVGKECDEGMDERGQGWARTNVCGAILQWILIVNTILCFRIFFFHSRILYSRLITRLIAQACSILFFRHIIRQTDLTDSWAFNLTIIKKIERFLSIRVRNNVKRIIRGQSRKRRNIEEKDVCIKWQIERATARKVEARKERKMEKVKLVREEWSAKGIE